MNMPPKLFVIAPTGKMGKLIIQAAIRRKIPIAGALGRKGAAYIGQDIGEVAQSGVRLNRMVSDDLRAASEADVIIDFSTTERSMEVLDLAVRYGKPLVCGTTGFSKEQKERLLEASTKIPLLYAANTSKAVHLMKRLLEITAKTIGERAQIDLIELHDALKLDAPSGTSKELGESIASAMGKELEEIAVYGRCGKGIRPDGEITFHSIRSGDISSSHSVIFGLQGERLEITHHAHNWQCFAEGAVDCALFLHDKSVGMYHVEDVI